MRFESYADAGDFSSGDGLVPIDGLRMAVKEFCRLFDRQKPFHFAPDSYEILLRFIGVRITTDHILQPPFRWLFLDLGFDELECKCPF